MTRVCREDLPFDPSTFVSDRHKGRGKGLRPGSGRRPVGEPGRQRIEEGWDGPAPVCDSLGTLVVGVASQGRILKKYGNKLVTLVRRGLVWLRY